MKAAAARRFADMDDLAYLIDRRLRRRARPVVGLDIEVGFLGYLTDGTESATHSALL